MKTFKELEVTNFTLNSPFVLKNEWMLISAEKEGVANTMTASWGGFGIMWNREVAFVVIRPQRYTKEFVDSNQVFSLSFFDENYKKDLSYLGKVSGRDENKISRTNLTLLSSDGVPYFEEAETVFFVKKLYAQPMDEKYFLSDEIKERWYPQKDYHILYIAEIIKVLHKED